MATSEQLEREAEATRAQIAATLDELRSRLTPGQVVDQLVDYARDSGGGDFVRNLGQQVVNNPLPVTLVGAGLAWLMMAGRRAGVDAAGNGLGTGQDFSRAGAMVGERAGAAAESLGDMGQATRDAASAGVADLSDRTRATAERLNERLGEAGAGLQESANAAGAAMRDATSNAYGAASNAYDAAAERSRQGADAFARGARSMRQGAAAGGQNLLAHLQEQPLVLAGIGLAVGAMLGASLPPTEVEDNLMGEASDATKRDAKAIAEEQVDKGKAVAEQAWDAAKSGMDEQLHGDEQHAGHDASSEATARHKTGGDATLVPSDETSQGDMATDAARHENPSE